MDSLARLLARTGVAVAHRRPGPSSSATSTDLDRLPGAASWSVQVRWMPRWDLLVPALDAFLHPRLPMRTV